MAGAAITGTPYLAASPTGYSGANSMLAQAIQVVWSREILFQAMPILRFEQFAVKKTELGVTPGLTINFMRYNNLPAASQLTEGIRMQTASISAAQFSITVAEQGFAIALSELLLNASFDDVMASASRLLGRNMATYLDTSSRNTLYLASSTIFGYTPPTTRTAISPYDQGTPAASLSTLSGTSYYTPALVKDAAQTLASKNVPRLGETYVSFIHPAQSREMRDSPEFIEVTKYAAPGNFMLGEIGRLYDTVFIETTQVEPQPITINTATPYQGTYYQAVTMGDNAFGHAISLPVELRDGGVLDFGREHALAWYAIWGLGLITDYAVVLSCTN